MDETGRSVQRQCRGSGDRRQVDLSGTACCRCRRSIARSRPPQTWTRANKSATSPWVQFWRLSDLTLLRSIALPPGPRGDKICSAVSRVCCRMAAASTSTRSTVACISCAAWTPTRRSRRSSRGSPGKNCGVGVLTGHYWLQTVPETHAVVALDIADPEHPREASAIAFGQDEEPHWLSIDPSGRRLVMNSSGAGDGNRLFVPSPSTRQAARWQSTTAFAIPAPIGRASG